MKVTNDTITLEDSDLALLAPGVRSALESYTPDALNFALSTTIAAAKQRASAKLLKDLSKIADAHVLADEETQATILSHIDALKGVAGVPPEPEPEKPGVMNKLKNLFGKQDK